MDLLSRLRTEFTSYLKEHTFDKSPKELYEPNNYFLSIGGKRLRPLMVLLANELYGGKIESALPAAMAIEYFHNFSLIHDDVMDAAPLRRGKQTIHEKYGLNTAILSGDVLLVFAYRFIAQVPKENLAEVLDIFNETAIEVCEGQQLDMNFETQEKVTEEEYLWMIRQKTSVVLAAALQIGALIGGATRKDADALYRYAIDLGVAFQIQDDILDCYGDIDLVGKQPGGDIIQNKKTLLLIRAVEQAQKNGDERLNTWLNFSGNKEEKVKGVLALYKEWGIKESVTEKRDTLIKSALEHLENTSLSQKNKEILAQLVDYLVIRTF